MEQLTAQPPAEAAERSAGPEPETIRLQATRRFGRVLSPRELWRYRDLAYQIAARDVTVRYRQTALGAAWAILQPVGFMVVFTLFFGGVAGVSSDGRPYALFSLAALVPWTYFANAMLLGSESLVSNAALVSKIYFPRIFMPTGALAAGFIDLGVSLAILFVILGIAGEVSGLPLLALPLLTAIMVAAALGVTSLLSAVNVRYRDVRYVIPFAIQMWLFASPVAYPSSLLDQPWQTLSAINPMVGVIEGFRWATMGGDAPWALIGVSSCTALLLLLGGLAYFDRTERSFADFI